MNREQFEEILNKAALDLTRAARKQRGRYCQSPKEFEDRVLEALERACNGLSAKPKKIPHQHSFPDIKVGEFGVEVKHTIKNTWLAVGNSIFEGMRDENVKSIYVVYGKMGAYPEARWARYEDCVTHVRISHAPRFVIDMEDKGSLFEQMRISYSEFSVLSPEEKMKFVRDYTRQRLKPGESTWWLEEQHTLPMVIKEYRLLDKDEKRALRAEATLLFPEVLKGGRAKGKYDRAGRYLVIHHGVIATQIRDMWTAGSVGARGGARGHNYIARATKDIEAEIKEAAKNLDDSLLLEYWGEKCPPKKRIAKWLEKADEYADGWKPSKILFVDD